MIKEIVIPKLGMSMTKAKILEWKAEEGGWVELNEIVLVIETDKVAAEIEAPISGFLHILEAPETVLPVGGVAGTLAETQEEFIEIQRERPAASNLAQEAAEVVAASRIQAVPRRVEKVKISPLAKKIAKESNIDITQITGSGPGGRIIKEDVLEALEAKKVGLAPPVEVYEGKKVKATIPFTGMRQAIAEHLHRSLSVSAQLTNMAEIDMAELIKVRKSFLQKEESIGVRISFTDLFVVVISKALKDYPIVNSSLVDNEIKIWQEINIGVAVALEFGEYESGLIVPVIKNADQKSLVQISKSLKELQERANGGKLTPDDVGGGTFTLSNSGVFGRGGGLSTPIINQPQSGLLQPGPIMEKPVVRNGEIVIRPMMPCSFTWDHRVMDGGPAAGFFGRIIELMENPHLAL